MSICVPMPFGKVNSNEHGKQLIKLEFKSFATGNGANGSRESVSVFVADEEERQKIHNDKSSLK